MRLWQEHHRNDVPTTVCGIGVCDVALSALGDGISHNSGVDEPSLTCWGSSL